MVFTREKNDTSNKNRERCFSTCEKNDTSNQKPQRSMSFAPKFPPFIFYRRLQLAAPLQHQTRTQSLFMCFWGERRLGDRLRRAGSHGKVGRKNRDAIFPSYLPMRSSAPQPNPQSSLTTKTHKKRLGTSLLQHRFTDIQREKFFSKSFSRKKVKNISEIRVE